MLATNQEDSWQRLRNDVLIVHSDEITNHPPRFPGEWFTKHDITNNDHDSLYEVIAVTASAIRSSMTSLAGSFPSLYEGLELSNKRRLMDSTPAGLFSSSKYNLICPQGLCGTTFFYWIRRLSNSTFLSWNEPFWDLTNSKCKASLFGVGSDTPSL